MWFLWACLLVLGIECYNDPYINGKWAVQGLGKINATFMTHVCIQINGDKASETWYMRSTLQADQQEDLQTEALEVKYVIDSDLTYNVTAPTPWIYSPDHLPPGQVDGQDGSIQFKATAVRDVSVSPAKYKDAMTKERQKYVGRSRLCLYRYMGDPSSLSMNIGCSSSKPSEGFYRFGETTDFPSSMPGDHAVMTRGQTCEASSHRPLWPVTEDGYRVELALAAEMDQVTEGDYHAVLRDLETRCSISSNHLKFVQAVPGSVVVRSFLSSDQRPALDTQLAATSNTLNTKAAEQLAGFPVIAMSAEWRQGATILVSPNDKDSRLQPVAMPLMVSVCLIGLVLYGVALKLLLTN